MTKVIIADDSHILRERLINALSEMDFVDVVGDVENVSKLIDMIEKLKPDIVIIDIRMSGGNGISALENIKKKSDSPIVIMFTNYPYLQYRKKCLELGADFFFYKGAEYEKLLELIRKLPENISSLPTS